MLRFEDVAIQRGQAEVVSGLSLTIESGQIHALLGPNGAGKSSLLQAAIGALPHTGRITGNKQIGYLTQNAPLPWPMTVRDFVQLGGPANATRLSDVVAKLGLIQYLDTPATELSGGQYARARIARVLMGDAPVVLFDEPVAHLDPAHQLGLMNLFTQLAAEGRAVGIVLHDLTLASRFSDQVSLLRAGQLIATGQPRKVLTPANLSQVFGIEARRHADEAGDYWIPWSKPMEEKHA